MADHQDKHLKFTNGFYSRSPHFDEASVRSAYGDAAHMCDAIAADIESAYTKRGRVTKEGKALANALRNAGEVIWAMRDQIKVPHV